MVCDYVRNIVRQILTWCVGAIAQWVTFAGYWSVLVSAGQRKGFVYTLH